MGDRVECDPAQIGKFKPGTVVEYPKNDVDPSGRYFYVKLDGSHITEGYVCMATHMRPLATGSDTPRPPAPRVDPAPAPRAPQKPAEMAPRAPQKPADVAPPTAGTLPALAGMAWKMDFGIRTANVQRFLFCTSGRWEVVSSQLLTGGALTLMGTYTVRGDSLVTRDANGGAVTTYKVTATGDALKLDSGKSTMRLYDPVPTQCK